MRQLCNLAYAVMVEGMDPDDRRSLDDRLEAPPWVTPEPRSRGVGALMGMFGPGGPIQNANRDR